jgi:hypothetical protein
MRGCGVFHQRLYFLKNTWFSRYFTWKRTLRKITCIAYMSSKKLCALQVSGIFSTRALIRDTMAFSYYYFLEGN